jgi:hypothetical protein
MNFGKIYQSVNGVLSAGEEQLIYSKDIIALDSYTKLLIHGDSIGDATGKTVTAVGTPVVTTSQYKFAEVGRSIAFGLRSNGSIDDEDMADITDWTDLDNGSGVSSQVTFDSKSCMKLDTGGTVDSGSQRRQDVGTFGIRTVFSMNLYFDAIGSTANYDHFVFAAFNGANTLNVGFGTNGVYIQGTGGGQNIGNFVVQDTWQEWTFDVNWTAKTVDVYLNKILKVSGLDCTSATATADGIIDLLQYGITTNRISYVDWFKVGSDFTNTTDYLTLADSDDWNYGTGDFTIDFWVRFNALPTLNDASFFLTQYQDNQNYWYVRLWNTGGSQKLMLIFVKDDAAKGYYIMSNAWSGLAINTWYHIAFVRTTTSAKIFIDGVSQTLTETTAFGTNNVGDIASVLYLGRAGDVAAAFLDGWVDELRISKGIARWTSDFTPPIAPYDGARTVINISGLNGNTDVEYRLICRIVSDNDGYSNYLLRPNNDSGANYGYQVITGNTSSVAAARSTTVTGLFLTDCGGYTAGEHKKMFSDTLIHAKSGYVRTGITIETGDILNSLINQILLIGSVWTNTVDNITSLVIVASGTNGLGVGTSIELYARRGNS